MCEVRDLVRGDRGERSGLEGEQGVVEHDASCRAETGRNGVATRRAKARLTEHDGNVETAALDDRERCITVRTVREGTLRQQEGMNDERVEQDRTDDHAGGDHRQTRRPRLRVTSDEAHHEPGEDRSRRCTSPDTEEVIDRPARDARGPESGSTVLHDAHPCDAGQTDQFGEPDDRRCQDRRSTLEAACSHQHHERYSGSRHQHQEADASSRHPVVRDRSQDVIVEEIDMAQGPGSKCFDRAEAFVTGPTSPSRSTSPTRNRSGARIASAPRSAEHTASDHQTAFQRSRDAGGCARRGAPPSKVPF
jgi:hypothetical protein